MPDPILAKTMAIDVGTQTVVESDTLDGLRGVAFEDDGETGYFYARDYRVPQHLFVDALHVYTVAAVTDKDIPSTVQILWSADSICAALIINQRPHAVFDFHRRCGYSLDNFPEPDPATGWTREPWHDRLRDHFFPNSTELEADETNLH